MFANSNLQTAIILVVIETLCFCLLCFLLARKKHMNTKLAICLGLIPGFNFLALIYYVGAPKNSELT